MKRYTTGQVSKQRNISVRTLRYYDQINLLTPSFKDENGRRYYSEEDLFTLEKIILLKSLSLPLEQIQTLLDKLTYKQLLISHHNHLQEQLAKLQTSISNTAALINMIDLEKSLSWEQITSLVQQSQTSPKKWMDYFEEDEQILLQEKLPNLSNNDDTTQQYISLLRRIESYIQQDLPPESEEGLQVALELSELANDAFQGDAKLMDDFWEIRKKPAEETGLYPLSTDVLEYVERCFAYAERADG